MEDVARKQTLQKQMSGRVSHSTVHSLVDLYSFLIQYNSGYFFFLFAPTKLRFNILNICGKEAI